MDDENGELSVCSSELGQATQRSGACVARRQLWWRAGALRSVTSRLTTTFGACRVTHGPWSEVLQIREHFLSFARL